MRHGDHQGRRGRDPSRPLAQSRHHARTRRAVAGPTRPGHQRADVRGAAALRRRPIEARHRLREVVSRSATGRRHADPQACGPVRPGEEIRQHEGGLRLRDEGLAARTRRDARTGGVRAHGHRRDPQGRHGRPDDGAVLRLEHAAGDSEGGTGDPDDVPHVAADAQARQQRGVLALARRFRSRAARGFGPASGPRGRRQDLGAEPCVSSRPRCSPRRARWGSSSSPGPSTIPRRSRNCSTWASTASSPTVRTSSRSRSRKRR